jgi:hypothetical protein
MLTVQQPTTLGSDPHIEAGTVLLPSPICAALVVGSGPVRTNVEGFTSSLPTNA